MNFFSKSAGKKIILIFIAFICLILLMVFSLFIGRYQVNYNEIYDAYNKGTLSTSVKDFFVIYELRAPRILMAATAGAVLSCGGVAVQSVFKNPIVSPFVIGISAGASLGAAIGIVIFNGNRAAIEGLAFILAAFAAFLAYIASGCGRNTLMFLLLGTAVSSFFNAIIGILQYFADPENQLPALTFWMLGGFDSISFKSLSFSGPLSIICLAVLYTQSHKMNIMALGDTEAASLGVNVNYTKFIIMSLCILMVSSCTSKTGVIGWIGLTVPHISRIILGPDNRFVFLLSAILGAVFLIVSDNIARTITAGELPVGIITSLIGAPIFTAIILISRKSGWGGDR